MGQKSQLQIETLFQELEIISSGLEKGDLPFEKALSQYQEGLKLLTQCRTYLKDAEILVKTLHEQYQNAQ
jgi:exodeoxyribonuclease VII small subunit